MAIGRVAVCARGNLRLRVSAQKLFKLNKIVDEIERQCRPEDCIFPTEDPRVTFKDREPRLLNRQGYDFSNLGNISGGLAAYNCNAAKTDIFELVGAGRQ